MGALVGLPKVMSTHLGRICLLTCGNADALDPTGRGRQRWTNRWKAALNAFEITFDERLSAGRKEPPSRSLTPLN